MRGRVTALVATAAATVSAAGAAVWARRKREGRGRRPAGGRAPEKTLSASAEETRTSLVATGGMAAEAAADTAAGAVDAAADAAEGAAAAVSEAVDAATGAAADTAGEARDVIADVADDLTAIKGIGAARAERLRELGVTSLAQIADWKDEDIESYAAGLKIGAERIRNEDWVGQARAAVDG